MPSLTGITIDFWNTIVDPTTGKDRRANREKAIVGLLEELGKPVTDERISAAIDSIYPIFQKSWFEERRTLSASECVQIVWNELEVQVPADSHARIVDTFENSILMDPPPLFDGAYEALHQLSKEFPLALISDTALSPGKTLREVLKLHGILDCFRHCVFSDETGVSKPHRIAFQSALDVLHLSARDAVHIGDIEKTDIAGAKDMGMKAILFHALPGEFSPDIEGNHTKADAVAESWADVLHIIDRWRVALG
jgi:putative hydrolase of the HAD superfamily